MGEEEERVASGGDERERLPRGFLRRLTASLGGAAIAVALLAALALGFEIVLVAFAGILLGVFLLALRDGLARSTPIPPGWSLLLVILVLLALVAGGGALILPRLGAQLDEFVDRVPELARQIQDFLGQYGWGQQILERVEGEAFDEIGRGLGSIAGFTAEAFVAVVGFLFIGLFVAISPGLYVDGFIGLLPLGARPRAREILAEMAGKLRWFLVARAVAMLLVGVSTAIALRLLDVPLALLLGVVAGLFTFVPYLGPIAAAVPIGLVALAEGADRAAWALLVYAIIQWIEGYLFDPLIVQRFVRILPALTVLAQILGGVLAGVLGVAVATPFLAVAQVLVQRAYREDLLGDRPTPPEPDPPDPIGEPTDGPEA